MFDHVKFNIDVDPIYSDKKYVVAARLINEKKNIDKMIAIGRDDVEEAIDAIQILVTHVLCSKYLKVAERQINAGKVQL